jgi:hypothetical protein
MRYWALHVGVAIALCVGVSAKNPPQPVSVLIQPEAEKPWAVKVLITNHSKHKIWFESCPDPYTVELTDSNGKLVPEKRAPLSIGQVEVCGRTLVYTIKPGETWNSEIDLVETYQLEAGTYALRLLWHFPWKVHKTSQGENWDTLTVSSNATTLTIVR